LWKVDLLSEPHGERAATGPFRRRVIGRRITVGIFVVAALVAAGDIALLLGGRSGHSGGDHGWVGYFDVGRRGVGRVTTENGLLAHVPASIRETCVKKPGLPGRDRPDAVVLCRTPHVVGVYYAAFADPVRLRSFLLSGGQGGLAPCFTRCCIERWNVVTEVARPNAPRTDAYKCWTDKDGEYIQWARDDFRILAWMKAARGQRARLLRAWRRAGPV
jgi:hypothetical protein